MIPEHRELGDVAYLLVASWLLGAKESRIPTSGGVLDRALFRARDQLPAWAREQLHFPDLRAGMRCSELPQILDFAQNALLTVAPNPTYYYTDIQVSEWNALDLLRELGVTEQEGRELGDALKKGISRDKVDEDSAV